MKYASVLLAVTCLLSAFVLAQEWVFEPVDSSATSGPTLARMSDGRLCVCYLSGDSIVRVAIKDTAWHYETVGPAARTSPMIAVGSRGTVGAVYDSGGIHYAERTDTSWAGRRVPMLGSTTGLAYDTADVPLVTSILVSWNVYVFASTRVDTGWLGVELFRSGPAYVEAAGSGVPPRFTSGNQAYVFAAYYWAFNIPVWGAGLLLFEGYRDSWRTVFDQGLPHYEAAAALALNSAEQPAWCHNDEGSLFLMGQLIDSEVGSASMQIDSLDRLQIAYVRSGMLMLRYRDYRGWHSSDVGVSGVAGVDLLLDDDMQPIIAYTTSAGAFLARGVDVVGTEESPEPRVSNQGPAATVVRGLPAGAVVFDAMGRRVVSAKPGVYFVGEGSGARGQGSGRMRKVIVQR
jgi:hypothetical protein